MALFSSNKTGRNSGHHSNRLQSGALRLRLFASKPAQDWKFWSSKQNLLTNSLRAMSSLTHRGSWSADAAPASGPPCSSWCVLWCWRVATNARFFHCVETRSPSACLERCNGIGVGYKKREGTTHSKVHTTDFQQLDIASKASSKQLILFIHW